MAAREEIQELERQVSDIQKGLLSTKATLATAVKAVARAADKVAAERNALTVAQSNLRHMRGPADHVVLAEFVEVKKIESIKKDALQVAQQELAKAENAQRKLERNVPLIEAALVDRRTRLKGYGQLEKFPIK